MLIPSNLYNNMFSCSSLSRRVNANSQLKNQVTKGETKLIKKGEC